MSTTVRCEGCGKDTELDNPSDPAICEDCARKAGLARSLPSRRPPLPCARCGHRELLRVQMRERTVVTGQQANEERAAPASLTFERGVSYKGFFALQQVPSAAAKMDQPYGLLDAYVCRSCGFIDWYAQEPEHIPVGAIYGTQLVVAKDPGDQGS